jgi:atypical dual specificity phosphatase
VKLDIVLLDWMLPGKLASGWRPSTLGLDELAKAGFTVIINLTRAPYRDSRFEIHDVPVENGGIPSVEQVEDFCALLDRCLRGGRYPIYVHCHAGLGRTGTMVACYFVRAHGLTAQNAITAVRRLRGGSIENELQEAFVRWYERWLKKPVAVREA